MYFRFDIDKVSFNREVGNNPVINSDHIEWIDTNGNVDAENGEFTADTITMKFTGNDDLLAVKFKDTMTCVDTWWSLIREFPTKTF